MKTIIIVSKCTEISPTSEGERNYRFSFKGVFAGDLLQDLILRGDKTLDVTVGTEYLIYAQMLSLEAGTVWGKILKIKPLDVCWDQEAV